MGQITVIIDKREYAIACDDGQEGHILKLSRILDEKAKMLSSSVGLINENMKLAMVGLILADELQELKSKSGDEKNNAADLQKIDFELAKDIDFQSQKILGLVKNIKEL